MSDSSSTSWKLLLKEVRKYPVLSKEVELQLLKDAKNGNVQAKNKVIYSNLRYCITMVRKYAIKDYPIEDLMSEALLGLLDAFEAFDLKHNVRFITYAGWYIQDRLSKVQPKQIHQSNTYLILRKTINKKQNELEQRYAYPIPLDLLSEELNFKSDFLSRNLYETHSLDDSESFFEMENEVEKQTSSVNIFAEPTLMDLFENLPPQEKFIVGWHIGIYGTSKNFSVLAKELNLSKVEIEKIYADTIEKLKKLACEI